jgi:pyruvate/2-oxoglutarate dehydrogenase complex dihydrolipoamide dehydrogenase (E3) component
MAAEQHADVVVVGLGVGGEAVGGSLAAAGLDVVGIESTLVGGECPYWGCIPSKMMIRAGNLLAEAQRIPGVAGRIGAVSPDWSLVARRIRDEATTDWDDQAAVDRFVGQGARFVRGTATILGPDRVEVPGEGVFVADRGLVVATGTVPVVPPIDGLADAPYWTNREAIEAAELPDSLIVLGGGAIGLELAQAYHRFGVAVTVVEAADRLLSPEEPESSELVEEVLTEEGIAVYAGSKVTRVRHDGAFHVTADGVEGPLTADRLLVATGRRPGLDHTTLERLGVDPEEGLEVDERLRVADGVWAVGDVTGKGAFTHMATYQADLVTADILGRDHPDADYRAVPRVTFTDPEVGSVGLTEAAAREQGIDVRTGTAQVPSTTRGWIHKAGNEGLIKLVVDARTDLLVGATSIGPAGGEMLGALTVAVHGKVPAATLEHMIYAYPTFHRGIQDALRDLRS